MQSSSNKRIYFLEKITIFILIFIIIFSFIILYSEYTTNNWYSILEISSVRSCKVNNDCIWFA